MYHTNVADKQLCIKPGVSGFFTSSPLTQEKVETMLRSICPISCRRTDISLFHDPEQFLSLSILY